MTPPTAARMGSAAWRGTLSCPTVISYLSSMPTSRKKIAIKKSFTNSSKLIDTHRGPICNPKGACTNACTASYADELATITARSAAHTMTAAAMVPFEVISSSVLRWSRRWMTRGSS